MTDIQPIRDFASRMVNHAIWRIGRAADMEMLAFGSETVITETPRRGPVVGPRFALHIQGGWRVVRDGRVFFGYDDLTEAMSPDDVSDVTRRAPPEPNLRDVRANEFFGNDPAHGRPITAADVSDEGDLVLTFDDGSRLEVFVIGGGEAEAYRLMDATGRHVVVTGEGVDVVGKPT